MNDGAGGSLAAGGTTSGAGGTASGSGGAGKGGAPDSGGDSIPLPEGSREFEHIVNLVNADAVPEIEALLRSDQVVEGLPTASRMFYEYYLDEYDFLIVLTDHDVENAVAVAAFDAVYRPARAATGDVRPVDWRLSHGSERLRGVIGGIATSGAPPLEHEFVHYWAAHLDPSLGFGTDSQTDYGSHWGVTSVYGQLGGFDAASMACATPAGAVPPDCEPEANGRFVYTFSSFTPYVNRFVDYAPLELYLMGLIPPAEVPESFVRLEGASFADATVDGNTVSIEADGTSTIEMSDILGLHGEVPLEPESDRHFKAAFVVVSAEPVPDDMLAKVSEWQEVFGNYVESDTIFQSFETRTGGRATLDTRLGRRRTPADPIPEPPEPELCSVTEQNCDEGLACYGSMARQCSVPGTLGEGEACEYNTDCLPGLGCPNRLSACAPYCDPFEDTATRSCAELCPGNYVRLVDDTDTTVGAYCLP